MKEVEFTIGMSIDSAVEFMKKWAEDNGEECFGDFNGHTLYSTDTIDDAYRAVMDKTKAEYEKEMQDWRDEYDRKEKEHKEKIPELTEVYREKARGVILEDQYDYWDKVVPIRLGDLYHGMELDCTLDLCNIMRDKSVSYEKRIRKAYDKFMDQGHSGMSASLVASMLRTFCPDGNDLADAVMNFRYEKK